MEPRFRAQLMDEATIVERGEQLKVWFVPLHDSWVRAKDHPAAEIQDDGSEAASAACPAGTVWQRSIEILLPPKTPLLCRVTRPLLESFQTLDYITKERRGLRRQVEERWFLLVGNYRLIRHREPASFTLARKEHEAKTSKPRR